MLEKLSHRKIILIYFLICIIITFGIAFFIQNIEDILYYLKFFIAYILLCLIYFFLIFLLGKHANSNKILNIALSIIGAPFYIGYYFSRFLKPYFSLILHGYLIVSICFILPVILSLILFHSSLNLDYNIYIIILIALTLIIYYGFSLKINNFLFYLYRKTEDRLFKNSIRLLSEVYKSGNVVIAIYGVFVSLVIWEYCFSAEGSRFREIMKSVRYAMAIYFLFERMINQFQDKEKFSLKSMPIFIGLYESLFEKKINIKDLKK